MNPTSKRRPPPPIAGIATDHDFAPFRVLIAGTSGSGKSTVTKKLLGGAGGVLERRDAAIVLDIGGDMRAFCEAKAPPGTPIDELDAHAVDGSAPAIAELLQTETDRQGAALKLIPDVKGDPNPFFVKTARRTLKDIFAILASFADEDFSLGDAIRLARNMGLARILGAKTPGVGDPWRTLVNDDSRGDVHATLLSALEPHSVVAALWDHAPRTVSLTEFARRREGVLIFPWKDRNAATLEFIYAFLFDTLADLLLEELSDANVWYFLDEFRELAPLKFVGSVVHRGSKSVVNIRATILSVAGLRDRYSADRAVEMLGLFNHVVILQCEEDQTADYLSRRMGEPDTLRDIPPQYTDPLKRGGTYGRSEGPRRNVSPDEILKCKSVDVKRDRLSGWIAFPAGLRAPFECPFLADTTVPLSKPKLQRPRSAEILRDFTLDAIDRLGLPAEREVVDAIREFNPNP